MDADVIDAALAAVVADDGEEEPAPAEKKEMKKKQKGEKRKRAEDTEQADGKIKPVTSVEQDHFSSTSSPFIVSLITAVSSALSPSSSL